MKLSKNYTLGSALAASALDMHLLSLLLKKGILTRDEMFELLETAQLSLEQLQSHFEASPTRQEFEDHLKAARFRIEEIRIALNIRHPSNPHQDQN
jgi:hypothetical protein